jgi:hypothetical protein
VVRTGALALAFEFWRGRSRSPQQADVTLNVGHQFTGHQFTGHPTLSATRVDAFLVPPPRLQVNRGTCHFGRYKIPRRPHPPPRVSRVSHHPPQVSGLTLAHPCSPTLTRPHPPPSARPIDSGCAGPFLAPGQRGRNGLPRRCRCLGCNA